MEPKKIKKRVKPTKEIRKNASRKTTIRNLSTYSKMDWDKIYKENDLAKEGLLVDAGLPVIQKEGALLPVWDMEKYAFLLKNPSPYTVNPKLWEQGKLNLNAGLFQVTENIYQIRGFDLANLSLIRSNNGFIVLDCLSTKETAAAALQFAKNHFGELSVSAVIITHSHVDHYGGVAAVMEYFINNDVKIYVPVDFTEHVIEENVTAGVAMTRRIVYQQGIILQKDEKGQIDVGIGKGAPLGTDTFTQKVEEISDQHSVNLIDGVNVEFLLALDTEAPSEMFAYFPEEHSLCIAEDANATMHNLYTLRGAKVRNAIAWAKSIQNALDLWGNVVTTVFGVHNWPRFGNHEVIDYLEKQRDIYQYINDQTLKRINQGCTIDHVGRMIKLPESLSGEWYNSQFYGTVNHNAKAVYQRYMGWYNSNPVDLNRLYPEESAKRYVEFMGGEDSVIEKAKISFHKEDYQWVAEVMKQVIYANPGNKEAKLLCADALEQLGYMQESGPWRNEYLSGARELRFGIIPPREAFVSNEVLDNIPLENILYLLSIRINGIAAGDLNYKINFSISDRNETSATEVKRGIFRFLSNTPDQEAVVTVTMPKEVLYRMVTTNQKPANIEIQIDGDATKWEQFLGLLENINPAFPIVTPLLK